MNAVPYTDIEQYFKVGVDPSCIEIDQTRNNLLHENSIRMLKDGYMLPDEGPQELFARVSAAVADSEEHAQRLYDYVSKLWFMYSTPILSNAGTKRGLTISCFSSTVDDSLDSITDHWKEQTYLTAKGGGTSGYWGRLRTDGVATSKGSASSGLIPFLKVMDAVAAASKQGNVRRGAYAAYLDVSHPEIMEFIDFRDPNGDPMRRSQNREGFHHGVCITDSFMEAVEKDEDWNLIDPHTNAIISTMKAREVWRKIIEMRVKTGEPYIVFEDTVNRYFPDNLKKKGLKSNGSNLCSEITLPKGKDYLDKDRTFVCCLSSVNLDKWDEWKDDPLFISDLIRMLDNNITLFLDNAPRTMDNAWHGARMTRDLGLGTMGFHSLLQRKGLAFESSEAVELNNQIYYKIWKESSDASLKLGDERAPYPDSYEIVSETSVGKLYVGGKTNGFRNAHRLAIAPNASSSTICGDVSPSIEPYSYNYKVETRKVGILSSKNPHLEALLESKGKNTDEVWNSIKKMDGSVQHLTFLTDHEKLVFKTAREIDQQWVVEHAAARQPFICQSQSVNLFITPKTPIKEINKVHMSAWKKGLKTLYYLRNMSVGDVKGISVVKSRESVDPDLVGCKSCEG
jgi:ribonucleoside-diphosphate reductase alpha chain